MTEKTVIKCQICGQPVNGDELYRAKLNEGFKVGHITCLQTKLQENGLTENMLNESVIQKTGILFE